MTRREMDQLVEEIARVAEHAYRRGFQQGFLTARTDDPPTEDQVARWRFAGDTASVGAPGTISDGRKASQVRRLEIEHTNAVSPAGMLATLLRIHRERGKEG